MNDNKILAAQRDSLAQYIFKQNSGDLYMDHCRREMEAGRCPYHDLPYNTQRTAEVCSPCIMKLVGGIACEPLPPFFTLLAEYHMLVSYITIGGRVGTGRVQLVEKGAIVFDVGGDPRRYRLEEIDVIVPREVLRWSRNGLSPVTWQNECPEPEPLPVSSQDISACLLSIGIEPFMEGAAELKTAVRMVMEDPSLLNQLVERLYPAVAEEVGIKASTAAYRLHKIIGTAKRNSWNTGKCQAFFNATGDRRANVKMFLRAFLEYIRPENAQPL